MVTLQRVIGEASRNSFQPIRTEQEIKEQEKTLRIFQGGSAAPRGEVRGGGGGRQRIQVRAQHALHPGDNRAD